MRFRFFGVLSALDGFLKTIERFSQPAQVIKLGALPVIIVVCLVCGLGGILRSVGGIGGKRKVQEQCEKGVSEYRGVFHFHCAEPPGTLVDTIAMVSPRLPASCGADITI